jgi:hypothetical protein
MIYGLLFLAGALICNGLPHLLSGLRGEAFYTPWAQPRGVGKSPAIENFLWGCFSLFLGLFLARHARPMFLPGGPLALLAGFVAAGCGLSIIFARRNGR